MRAACEGGCASVWMLDLNSILNWLQIRWDLMLLYWEFINWKIETIESKIFKIWLWKFPSARNWTFWPNDFLTFSYEPQSGMQSKFIQPIRPICIHGFVIELFLCVFFVAAKMKLTPFYHPLLHLLLIINLTGEQKLSCLFEMIA